MIDKRQQVIKERLQRFAMDLWNITDPGQMDPVIDLILDVVAYNSSRLYQSIDESDASILHRLARLLVPHKWSLPSPAHALLTVTPQNDDVRWLSPTDLFYTKKMVFERGQIEIGFSPLSKYPLLNARINTIALEQKLIRYTEDDQYDEELPVDFPGGNEDSMWVGLKLSEEQLRLTKHIVFCILPDNSHLAPFVKEIKAYGSNGQPLGVSVPDFPLPNSEKYPYFEDITSYYANNFIQIDLEKQHRSSRPFSDFPAEWNAEETTTGRENLFWIKLCFPQAFLHTNLEKVRVLLNTYPAVNRNLAVNRHDFTKQGSIIPLPCNNSQFILNVESLQDDLNHEYVDVAQHYGEQSFGTYSLYYGNIERFDSDNARTLILKLLQLAREDGSAFNSLNVGVLIAQLGELYNKIEEIEKTAYDAIQTKGMSRTFLFTQPYKGVHSGEVRYWTTDGEIANGLDNRAPFFRFDNERFSMRGISFQTVTKQGNSHNNEHDLINRLRYGLLTRDRIVTNEDVKSFLQCHLGQSADGIDIKDGIAISPDIRRGIIRTTEVRIRLSRIGKAERTDLPAMTCFLEEELSKRSVSNTPYKIFFV